MTHPQRSSDVIEIHSEKALRSGLAGLFTLALGALLVKYETIYLGWLLVFFSACGLAYSAYCLVQAKKVTGTTLDCPYCAVKNTLTENPEGDFSCHSCHRMVPVTEGKIMPVMQVRCGYCNTLNFYSEKSEGLICEDCDRKIPISVGEGHVTTKAFDLFTRRDDDALYELRLVKGEKKCEELVDCLQHMLALNRNQVKDMLDNLPVTLLAGIPRMKAEMLSTQIGLHHGAAEFTPVAN